MTGGVEIDTLQCMMEDKGDMTLLHLWELTDEIIESIQNGTFKFYFKKEELSGM